MPLLEEKWFEVKITGPWDRAYAGEWLPLTFQMTRPSGDDRELRLENLRSLDAEVELDIDMFQHGVLLRPGENYRFQIPVRVKTPQKVSLKNIEFTFQVQENGQDKVFHQSAGDKEFEVKPSLRQALSVKLETLCQYDEGTKVLATFTHQGALPLEDFSIAFGPEQAVAAGKTNLRRSRLEPRQEERVDLVVSQNSLDVVMTAKLDGKISEWRDTFPVAPPQPKDGRRFRFLEPRHMASDEVSITRTDGLKNAVPQDDSRFLLHGDSQYELRIHPAPGAQDVTLDPMQMGIHVRKRVREGNAWVFTLDVASAPLFRKSNRLYYEVETRDGKRSEDIPVCVMRTPMQYGATAFQVGALSMLGCIVSVWGWGQKHGFDWEEFDFLNVARFLAIPGILLAYWFADWLQYQLRK